MFWLVWKQTFELKTAAPCLSSRNYSPKSCQLIKFLPCKYNLVFSNRRKEASLCVPAWISSSGYFFFFGNLLYICHIPGISGSPYSDLWNPVRSCQRSAFCSTVWKILPGRSWGSSCLFLFSLDYNPMLPIILYLKAFG